MSQLTELRICEVASRPTLTITFRAPAAEISANLARIFPAVWQYAEASGAQITGQPFSRYLSVAGPEVEIEAGVPIARPAPGQGEITASQLPGGEVAIGVHLGTYEELPSSHEKLAAWIAAQGRTPSDPPWETYVTDPSAEPDASKWRTEIALPIA